MESTKTMKKEKITLANCIEIDKENIKNEIENNGEYLEDGVQIKKWEGDKESDYYIGSLKKGKYSYMGILNTKIRRQEYGVNYYDNDDIYFGYYESDVKSMHGAYYIAPVVLNGFVNSEYYHGYWKENQKDGRGIYVWSKQKEGSNLFNTADFNAFVGEFESDSYKRGCYFTKIGESFYVYYGSFDSDGRKNDQNAYFYDNVSDRVFTGKIVNDKFVNGHLVSWLQNGEVKDIIYVEFNKHNHPEKFKKTHEIDPSEKTAIGTLSTTFKDTLLSDDYFSKIFNKGHEVKEFIDTEMKDMHLLDSEEGYPKIMKICSSYNDIVRLYTNLEKNMKD